MGAAAQGRSSAHRARRQCPYRPRPPGVEQCRTGPYRRRTLRPLRDTPRHAGRSPQQAWTARSFLGRYDADARMIRPRTPPSSYLLMLLLGMQPVATDLYLPALPEIAASFGGPVAQVK